LPAIFALRDLKIKEPIFINADLIAAGLSPFQPELAAIKADRLMLKEIKEHARSAHNFAFETTQGSMSFISRGCG
jgi:predicted ABC-type ATPase